MPLRLTNDAINGRQPEARAFVGSLGREKWFKDAGLRGRIHAATGVADGEDNMLASMGILIKSGVFIVERDIGGLDGELPSHGHGVPGIDRQVHDHLFELPLVRLDAPQVGGQVEQDVDIFADEPAEHGPRIDQKGVEIEDARLKNLLSAKRQKPAVSNSARSPALRISSSIVHTGLALARLAVAISV